MTSIVQDGGILHIGYDGVNYYYQQNSGSLIIINKWPVTISNTYVSSNNLTVLFDTDLPLSTSLNTFTIGSSNIVFDGANRSVIINFTFGGLIQNGMPSAAGFSNISIKNIRVRGTGIISNGNGGVCRSNFGRGATNILIENCSNSLSINAGAGGILGDSSGYNSNNFIVRNCFNTGNVGNGAGGIAGPQFLTGTITFNGTVFNCYNTGNISASNSGGICGPACGSANSTILIEKSYNLGTTANSSCGGILGGLTKDSASPFVTISNCYTLYGSVYSNTYTPTPTITNCYEAGGAFNTVAANAALTGVPSINNPGITWISLGTNLPFILTGFNAQLYNPNTATSTSTSFTSIDSVFSSAYNYAVLSTSAASATTTGSNGALIINQNSTASTVTNVTAYLGTTSGPYDYNTNTLSVLFDLGITSVCFLRGSKILTEDGYKEIEMLSSGVKVETYKHGLKEVKYIGFSKMYHNANNIKSKDKLFRLKKNNYPDLMEDLIVTGCHCILEKGFLNEDEWNKTMEINGNIFQTDDYFRLPACVDQRSEIYDEEGVYEIWHLALEHEDEKMNYGIYANGLLVESTSIRMLRDLSGMTLV
jgi:hypothetical protein